MKHTNKKMMDFLYCHGKRCYTKKGAETMRNVRLRHGVEWLRIYPCPFCHWWHITHHSRRR